MGTRGVAACLGLGLAGMAALAPPALAATRADVPIGQTALPDGDIRYHVPISIGGGAPIEASLDTGSFGVRILAAAVASGQYETTSVHRSYAFGGGARFNGNLARATIGVGPLQTGEPMLFQVVDTVDCVERQPHCPASRLTPAEYRIAGDGYAGQGFEAILGISMRKAPVADAADNPLTRMGDASWIVILPRPGSAEAGHLIINPTDEDRAGFDMVRLEPQDGTTGWADAALSGCLVEETSRQRHCGKTVIDSGGPGFFVDSAGAKGPTTWAPGTKATFELSGAASPIRIPFTAGRGEWSTRVVVHPPRDAGAPRLSAGTLPFFSYALLYDAKAGAIGFKPRDASTP